MKNHFKSIKKGFTLAEVLITLGVIGVVAALTLPSLIQSYEKKVTATRLKKFYSTMLNVIKLSENDNGEMSTWEFPKQMHDKSVNIFFKKYYLPYMNGYNECYYSNCFSGINYVPKNLNNPPNGLTLVDYIVKTSDGMYIYFFPNIPQGYFWMYVDINASKRPNIIGRDIFVFDIYGFPYSLEQNYRLKFWGHDRPKIEQLLTNQSYGCNKEVSGYAGYYCGEVILRNNWEIPENYPW